MCKKYYIVKKIDHKHEDRKEHEHQEYRPRWDKHKDYSLPYEREASEFMADGFRDYIKKHGYHFTDELAEHVSKMMVNRNGKEHTWAVEQVLKAMSSMGYSAPKNVTDGDITYLANMYYADLYDKILKDESSCLKTAYIIATDPDGYDGMIFSRWTSDAIGKNVKIDWEKFI